MSTAAEPVRALVAETGGQLVGLVHYLFHRSTTLIEDTCYLQDLFTNESVVTSRQYPVSQCSRI